MIPRNYFAVGHNKRMRVCSWGYVVGKTFQLVCAFTDEFWSVSEATLPRGSSQPFYVSWSDVQIRFIFETQQLF